MSDPASRLPGVGLSLPYRVQAAVTRVRSAAWLARSRGRAQVGGLRILLYHRVADDRRDPLALSPARFRAQMELLASTGYRAADLLEALALLDAGDLPPRTVALTFDGGFADVRDAALPVLASLGFRATVFVTTAVTEGERSFPWYEGEQPLVLGWDEVARLDREGTLRFEAHTVTHPSLPALDDEDAWSEIVESRAELTERLGRAVTAFAYPAGLFGERERRLVREAGYTAAVSCEPGVNGPLTDRFALYRRQIDGRDRLIDFRAKVGGGHDTPLPLHGFYLRTRSGTQTAGTARVQ